MPVKESTRNIFRMHGKRFDRAIHNYVYFVFYDLYKKLFLMAGRLAVPVLDRLHIGALPFVPVYERYHSKVMTAQDARKILRLEEDVIMGPDTSERIIPYHYANNIILKEPDFIAVMDCACRMTREHPCEPVDVCMAVGRTTAQFWLEHGAKFHARRITQEEALEMLRQGHERGHITTAWFKVATGGRTGVICSCCKCCCGALEARRLTKSLERKGRTPVPEIMVPSGYTVNVDRKLCDGCGTCSEVCVFSAVSMDGTTVVQSFEDCMGCSVCVEKCSKGARSLVRDPSKGDPLDIDAIVEELKLKGGAR